MQVTNYKAVKDEFFEKLEDVHSTSKETRACSEYPDFLHLSAGVHRALNIYQSGRDFIQMYQMKFDTSIDVGRFFDALKSPRRTRYIKEISQKLYSQFCNETPDKFDLFAEHKELKGYEIYATDGHCHAASAHEDPIANKKRAPCSIFSLNLRTHYLNHLTLCAPQNGKKKEHEITALKRQDANVLRNKHKTGTKVVHAYDPACIDYRFWDKSKNKYGIYFVTLEKSNSALIEQGNYDINTEDDRNNGVTLDELVGVNNGSQLRRITYTDPVIGKEYVFITNLSYKIPPGLIAFIYKCRWDIEKAFYGSKCQLNETKSWAKTDRSKEQQCCFITIIHNLILYFERLINTRESIVDEKIITKRKQRKKQEKDLVELAGRKMNSLVGNCSRATNRSLQFIRWLRHQLEFSISWDEAMKKLSPYMEKYIQ